MPLTTVDQGLLGTYAQYTGFKNRIINGDMRIDQRNNGAIFTSFGNQYCLDRWLLQAVGATNTAQQVTGSTGNNKAVRITGNASNILTGFSQRIESWNILDCASQSVTVSFTLSGSSSGSVSIRRLYPTATDNYTGTTEPDSGVTVTFTTTATRYTATFTLSSNANKGLWLYFDFGAVGSGVTRTLEDVQLEAGSTATSFDRRDYGRELIMCQRYYYRIVPGAAFAPFGSGLSSSSSTGRGLVDFPVTMRSSPTALEQSGIANDYGVFETGGNANYASVPTFLSASAKTAVISQTVGSGLTAGRANYTIANTTSAYLGWSAEL